MSQMFYIWCETERLKMNTKKKKHTEHTAAEAQHHQNVETKKETESWKQQEKSAYYSWGRDDEINGWFFSPETM